MENVLKDNNLKQHIEELLKNTKFSDEKGILFVNKILEAVEKIDTVLVEILIKDEKAKKHFFSNVLDTYVMNQFKLIDFFSMNNYFEESYTSYTNKIGLIRKDDFIKKNNDVVLAFPYKDCVLEGGQTKDDQKGKENFFNEVLDSDEIDRLFESKVLINIKRYSKDGVEEKPTITGKDNLILKGNNLLALHSLNKKYAGKIKLIYIDPPYNTGSDSFNYNDNFNHSTWLTFMKNRLEVAKELLRDDGVIFVQCDDNEQAYLKVLMDEVFGIRNFVNMISAKVKNVAGASGGGEDKKLKKNIEYILIYSLDSNLFEGFNSVSNSTEISKVLGDYKKNKISWKYTAVLVYDGDKHLVGSTIDGDGNDISIYTRKNFIIKSINSIAKDENISIQEVYKKYFNRIFRTTIPQSSIRTRVMQKVKELNCDSEFYSIEYVPRSGKNKNVIYEQFYKGDKFNLFAWFSDVGEISNGNVYKTDKIGTLWDKIDLNNLTKEGSIKFDNGKKPEALLKTIINMTTQPKDLVLDYHLGSGTTCAVAHKMGRQYIGIEQMDYIQDITVERMKKVIDGEQGGISKSVSWQGGGDFIYAELKQVSNFDNSNSRLKQEMRYLPIGELEDKDYNISKEEIDINKAFYGVDDE